jgi:hypothetical protein
VDSYAGFENLDRCGNIGKVARLAHIRCELIDMQRV